LDNGALFLDSQFTRQVKASLWILSGFILVFIRF